MVSFPKSVVIIPAYIKGIIKPMSDTVHCYDFFHCRSLHRLSIIFLPPALFCPSWAHFSLLHYSNSPSPIKGQLSLFDFSPLEPTAPVVTIDKCSPVLTVLFAALLLRESVNGKILPGVLLVTAGALIVAFA